MLFNFKKNNSTLQKTDQPFKFLSYYFDKTKSTAIFCYQSPNNIIFTEKVFFSPLQKFNSNQDPKLDHLLDQAMFLTFIAVGTSYYKAMPTPNIQLEAKIDNFQANFFNKIYQEGLSQFAFENHLTRDQLAHFFPTLNFTAPPPVPFKPSGIISLQSGGKDSILTATLLKRKNLNFTPWYVSSNAENSHPQLIDHYFDETTPQSAQIVTRQIDHEHLSNLKGLNGHVPITLINLCFAIIQAILDGKQFILTSVSQEGEEPASYIGDLPVNHQWSKTWEAEQLTAAYVERYITPDLAVGSPLRCLSELAVAERFVNLCWQNYGLTFSSCNKMNYRQHQSNSVLKWCGECAKCANTYLLFCPFLPPEQLQQLFADQDLFTKENLMPIFQGLLSVNSQPKPFECVSSADQLRFAYHHRQTNYSKLPFEVPLSNFNYQTFYPMQTKIANLNLLS